MSTITYPEAMRIACMAIEATPSRLGSVLGSVLSMIGPGYTLTAQPTPADLRDEVTLATFIRLHARSVREAVADSEGGEV